MLNRNTIEVVASRRSGSDCEPEIEGVIVPVAPHLGRRLHELRGYSKRACEKKGRTSAWFSRDTTGYSRSLDVHRHLANPQLSGPFRTPTDTSGFQRVHATG